MQPVIDEKAPDTPLRTLVVNGVTVTSRYITLGYCWLSNKAAEFSAMTQALLLLSEADRQPIRAFWCDSKCGAFTLTVAWLQRWS
jgi:hypothetical protein